MKTPIYQTGQRIKKTGNMLVIALSLTFCLFSLGCSKNKSDESSCSQAQKDMVDFTAAQRAFLANQTAATCNNLKTVTVRFLESASKCPQMQSSLQSMQAAINDVNNMNCSGF